MRLPGVRKAFLKHVKFLEKDFRHPSLHAKKCDESKNRWRARVNRGWRFYFNIVGDTYIVRDVVPHPTSAI
jgi:plasmid maintenance system killer protein